MGEAIKCTCYDCAIVWWEGLMSFWDRMAERQSDPAERDRCEDEAWGCARTVEATRRDRDRMAALQAQGEKTREVSP